MSVKLDNKTLNDLLVFLDGLDNLERVTGITVADGWTVSRDGKYLGPVRRDADGKHYVDVGD